VGALTSAKSSDRDASSIYNVFSNLVRALDAYPGWKSNPVRATETVRALVPAHTSAKSSDRDASAQMSGILPCRFDF